MDNKDLSDKMKSKLHALYNENIFTIEQKQSLHIFMEVLNDHYIAAHNGNCFVIKLNKDYDSMLDYNCDLNNDNLFNKWTCMMHDHMTSVERLIVEGRKTCMTIFRVLDLVRKDDLKDQNEFH